MNLHKKILLLLGFIIFISGCRKSESVSPVILTNIYHLPQGNQPYDDSIVEFYKKYGSYTLYKFSQTDANTGMRIGLVDSVLLADPSYIGKAFSFFKTNCLGYYPETFVQKTLPRTILLSSGIFIHDVTKVNWIPIPYNCHATDKFLTLGFVNKSMDTASVTTLKKFIGGMHGYYAYCAVYNQTIQIPATFTALHPIFLPGYREGHPEDYLSVGILQYLYQNNYSQDFADFVALITSTTAAEREAGIFTPKVDVSGKIKKKCKIVIDYYNDILGIDLVAIGNSQPLL